MLKKLHLFFLFLICQFFVFITHTKESPLVYIGNSTESSLFCQKDHTICKEALDQAVQVQLGQIHSKEIYSWIHITFTPTHQPIESYTSKPKILIVSVHGTFANTENFGTNIYRQDSEYFHTFAKQLAYEHNQIVELIAFQWSGSILQSERKKAGLNLALYLQANYHQHSGYSALCCIGHSHGCNVIFHAAQQMKQENIPINHAIFIGSPRLDSNNLYTYKDNRYNILNLYNFWSGCDITAPIGSIVTLQRPQYDHVHAQHEDETVHNIRIQKNGGDFTHSALLSVVMQHLMNLLITPKQEYPLHFDLDANIEEDIVQLAIRNDPFNADIMNRLPKEYKDCIYESRHKSDSIKNAYFEKYKKPIHLFQNGRLKATILEVGSFIKKSIKEKLFKK